jgi:hypothetical protein
MSNTLGETDAARTEAVKAAYLQAAEAAVKLLAEDAVAAAWDTASALESLTVGGLAGHLAQQILRVAELCAAPAGDDEPIPLLDHFGRSRWVTAAVHDESNVNIRRAGDAVAADGAAALTKKASDTLAALRLTLASEAASRVVRLPAWSLNLEDFLRTRILEITVHLDDLAVSVGLPTPALPGEVLDPTIDLLSRLAVRRHGRSAVLRALSRAERAPATISAF